MPTATQDILLYQSPDGQIRLDVQLDHDTVWLTQAQLTELFDISKKTVRNTLATFFVRKN